MSFPWVLLAKSQDKKSRAEKALYGVNVVSKQAYGQNVTAEESERQLTLWIAWVIKVILSWVGVILLAVIIFSGYLWLTAGGSPEQVDKAKKWIRNGIIGIAITTGAYFISDYVIEALSGQVAL